MDTNRISKQVLQCKPKGRRNVGRPEEEMEGPISFWGYKEQKTRLILHENDDKVKFILVFFFGILGFRLGKWKDKSGRTVHYSAVQCASQ